MLSFNYEQLFNKQIDNIEERELLNILWKFVHHHVSKMFENGFLFVIRQSHRS